MHRKHDEFEVNMKKWRDIYTEHTDSRVIRYGFSGYLMSKHRNFDQIMMIFGFEMLKKTRDSRLNVIFDK